MDRPRFRFTLGRLMAWIAFAAVNLAVLAPFAQKSGRTRGGGGLLIGVILLGFIYAFAYQAYRQKREIDEASRDPIREHRVSGCLGMIGLAFSVTVVVILLIVLTMARAS